MKLTISPSAARAAAFIAIVTRVFYALALESPGSRSGAWLSALLCAGPAVLWLGCLIALKRRSSPAAAHTVFLLVLLACALLDGFASMSTLARSAGYLALDRVPPKWLALPVGAALFWCILKNGDAVGYAAMLAVKILGAALVLVALLQLRYMRAAWLHPILGGGVREVCGGAIYAAGACVPASSVLLLCDAENKDTPGKAFAALLGAIATAALMLALRQMMAPVLLRGDTWLNRLDVLLSNGRSPLYMQLPMIALWYAGLMHLCLCDGFAAAALLQRVAPTLDGRACAGIAALLLVLLCWFQSTVGALVEPVRPYLFSIVSAIAAAITLIPEGRKGGGSACVQQS